MFCSRFNYTGYLGGSHFFCAKPFEIKKLYRKRGVSVDTTINKKGVIIMRNDLLKGLTDEQIKKVEACKSPDEILALAKAEGVELSEEQLEAVSGGCGTDKNKNKMHCYCCGSYDMKYYAREGDKKAYWECQKCGADFPMSNSIVD